MISDRIKLKANSGVSKKRKNISNRIRVEGKKRFFLG